MSTDVNLWYEVCRLGTGKSDLRALDFVVDRFFMKLFQTGNIQVDSSVVFSLKNVVMNFIWLSSGYIISHCCQLFNVIVFFPFLSFIVLCL